MIEDGEDDLVLGRLEDRKIYPALGVTIVLSIHGLLRPAAIGEVQVDEFIPFREHARVIAHGNGDDLFDLPLRTRDLGH